MEPTNPEARSAFVTHADSESLLAAVERATANRNAGIFGPGSASWKINRESALFLGAGRAALLQLAHPWVATALEQHSNIMAKPIARFHNTFRIVFTMIFGSLDQSLAAARHLYALHTQIQGAMPEEIAAYRAGSHYQANEIAALRWVYATLVESAVLAYECLLPPLSCEEITAYYAESKMLAALFGLPGTALPDDWPGFLEYCRQMERSSALGVGATARAMAGGLLAGSGSWLRPPVWYRALTLAWLPERFRAEFGFAQGEAERAAMERAKRWLPRVYCRLPGHLRFVGPWHEAGERLANRRTGLLTRTGNLFWIGQALLPFGDRK